MEEIVLEMQFVATRNTLMKVNNLRSFFVNENIQLLVRYDQVMELNDMLDACPNREAQRRLFSTFPKECHDAVIAEHAARTEDRVAPVGSLVAPLNPSRGINIVAREPGRDTYATLRDIAIVVGQPTHGSCLRLLWLFKPWENAEGMIIHWAEASSHELKVINGTR